MFELLKQPWPWYTGGILIGLMVPLLLILGNKYFGISSTLRHICAACLPVNIPFFKYNWRKEAWNLFFVAGIMAGAFLAVRFFDGGSQGLVSDELSKELAGYGITDLSGFVPQQVFSFQQLFTAKGLILMAGGGFLVGFGTRYAGGCTSGHSIMGLSNLQFPSLVATVCFLAGGFIMANLLLPVILSL